MDWNVITKHADVPFDIEITSFDNQKVKVIMKKYLQPEEDDLEIDGIGLEHKKLLLCIIKQKNLTYIMDQRTKLIKYN